MELDISDFSVLIEIGEQLSNDNVQEFIKVLDVPKELSDDVITGIEFLILLKNWNGHKPKKFNRGLVEIGRSDLSTLAKKVQWLAVDPLQNEELSIKSLIRVLKDKIFPQDWVRIDLIISTNMSMSFSFEEKMLILVKEGFITSDLTRLANLMWVIKRKDIALVIKKYQNAFDKQDFSNFKQELASLSSEIPNWKVSLLKFLKKQTETVKQLFDREDMINLESIYVPLTIIDGKLRSINNKAKTTFNDIELLTMIASKETDISPINFTDELNKPSSLGQIWCVLGNAGSGKTFLSLYTVLLYEKGELEHFFTYCIYIPCGSQDWHTMEHNRYKSSISINDEFIQQWLHLSLPKCAHWTSDFVKYIVNSDGDRLLIILDNLDEYIKEIPIKITLLYKLLTRQCLSRSTIIVTSRPGGYYSFSAEQTPCIDRFFQVLGFIPENRDKYFRLQLTNENKLLVERSFKLLDKHEELKLLSLLPVNASLFASLIRNSKKVDYTLTNLYSELIAYLIRRQLSRMGLKELTKEKNFSHLNSDVRNYLNKISEVVYMSMSREESEMTLIEKAMRIPLKAAGHIISFQCLGLMEEHLMEDSLGETKLVRCFPHYTIKEFLAAVWLSSLKHGQPYLITRYIVNSDDDFSKYKMIVRFLCGLFSKNVHYILYILYKNLLSRPSPMYDLPLDYESPLPELIGWIKFTQNFAVISEMYFESTPDYNSFEFIRKLLPERPYFYIEKAMSHNQSECFVKFIHLLPSIQLIYCDTRYLTSTLFDLLITKMACPLSYLTVKLFKQNYSTLSAYTEVIRKGTLTSNTKISLELIECHLECKPEHELECKLEHEPECILEDTNNKSTSIFHSFTSLSLSRTYLSPRCLRQLSERLTLDSAQKLVLNPDVSQYNTLVLHIHTATQLTSLHLNIPYEFNQQQQKQQLQPLSQRHKNLKELSLTGDFLSLLPHVGALSSLQYLRLESPSQPTYIKHNFNLLQLLSTNRDQLRVLRLSHLQYMGPKSWDQLLNTLEYCAYLVQIKLSYTELVCKDSTLWDKALNKLKCLIYMALFHVTIPDFVMRTICIGLVCHSSIRQLDVQHCSLDSKACKPLKYLIPTLPKINLNLTGNDFSEQDIEDLKKTAYEYDVHLEFEVDLTPP